MANNLTISARRVAEGVGLPPVWLDDGGYWWQTPAWLAHDPAHDPEERGVSMRLTDAQTAIGVALRLDEWGSAYGWAVGLAPYCADLKHSAAQQRLAVMAAKVHHIGMDHAIRRALGEDPKPGTLAILTRIGNAWRLDSREHGGVMIEWSAYPGDGGCTLGMATVTRGEDCPRGYVAVPALADITDPEKALAAIYEGLRAAGRER